MYTYNFSRQFTLIILKVTLNCSSEEVFSSYVCNSLKHIEKIQKHPGDIVEAGSLAVSIYLEVFT